MSAKSPFKPTSGSESTATAASMLADAQTALISSTRRGITEFEQRSLLQEVKKLAAEALKLEEENSEAYHMLALSESLLGESDQATDHIEEAFRKEQDSPTALLYKGYVHLAGGLYTKAEQEFTRALEKQPQSAEAFLGIAQIKQKREQWQEAFLHYQTLIQMGEFSSAVQSGITQCVGYLNADRYSEELERTILIGLRAAGPEVRKYRDFINSLFIQKYDLANPEATVDLPALLSDDLFYAILAHRLIASPEVEDVATNVRREIFLQVTASGELPEATQPWVIVLAECATALDHPWSVKTEEYMALQQLEVAIDSELLNRSDMEEFYSALLLVAMYYELYDRAYRSRLLRWDLQEWPEVMQPLLATSLYEPCALHQVEMELSKVLKPEEEVHQFMQEMSGIYPKWHADFANDTLSAWDFYKEQFGKSISLYSQRKRPLQVLVTDCGSGAFAVQQAATYSDVMVTACDGQLTQLSYAEYQARRCGVENVTWVHTSGEDLTPPQTPFDIVDWIQEVNYSNNLGKTFEQMKKLTSGKGFIKFRVEIDQDRSGDNLVRQFVEANNMTDSAYSCHSLREVLLRDVLETGTSDWEGLMQRPDFYHLSGFRKLIFTNMYRSLSYSELDQQLVDSGLEVFCIIHRRLGKLDLVGSLSEWRALNLARSNGPQYLVIYCKMSSGQNKPHHHG